VLKAPAWGFDVLVTVLLPPIHVHPPLFRMTGLPPNVTLRRPVPVMLRAAALIVKLPAVTPLATPVLLISPAAGLLLDQVTVEVQSDSLLSE
jgi:hypothetical protein